MAAAVESTVTIIQYGFAIVLIKPTRNWQNKWNMMPMMLRRNMWVQ